MHASPLADTADSSPGPRSVSRRPCCRSAQGRRWSRTEAAPKAPISCTAGPAGLSQDDPKRGALPTLALMTSTAAREKQALRQQRGGTIPEQPSAIEKDAGGEIPPGLLGVPQWTRTSSAGQEYNCMSHRRFFHAMPEETSF